MSDWETPWISSTELDWQGHLYGRLSEQNRAAELCGWQSHRLKIQMVQT